MERLVGKYFPYGQERPSATQDGTDKFATYFRDSETGLDYADQRYHQPGMGRFMTPDRMVGNAKVPSSFNKYSYTGGDPINRVDETGQYWHCSGPGEPCHLDPDDDPSMVPFSSDPTGDQSCLIAVMVQDWQYYSTRCIQPGVGAGQGGGPTIDAYLANSAATAAVLVAARGYVENMSFSEQCDAALHGIEDKHSNNPTIDGIRAAAHDATFVDFRTSGSVDPRVVAQFENPMVYMVSLIPQTDSDVGKFNSIYYRTGFEQGRSPAKLRADVLHELLHTMGFEDANLQKGLGVAVDATDTDNISRKLQDLCF